MASNGGRRFKIDKHSGSANQERSIQKELAQARTTGTLNLSNRELEVMPPLFPSPGKKPSDVAPSFDSESPRWWEDVEIRKLFIQCNKLSQIPPEIIPKLVDSLVVLDVHDNRLRDLPILIGDLQLLESLNLSHNVLSALPEMFVNLHKVVDLNISYNELSVLPAKWNSLCSLTNLNLSNNKLNILPDSFGHCTTLTSLNLSNNQLQKLPGSFCKLVKLETLDLSFNKLSHSDFASLEKLKVLKMDHNLLTVIPDVRHCRGLKELSVCDNAIVEFSFVDVECLRTLAIFNLRGNKVSVIPTNIAPALQQLERLDLANNEISMIPPEFGLIESLKSLNLDGNPLRALRRDVVNRGTVFVKQWLVSRLPDSVLSAQSAQENVMKAIPDSRQEKTGDRGDLSNCGMENVITLLSQANPAMKELILSKNRLQSLDGMIALFSSLCFLDISCNVLRSLPEELRSLSRLRQLNISNNRFTGPLPAVIYSFADLEVLIASDNALDKLDTDLLITLRNLAVLDIKNNNFAQLDCRLAICPSLKHLEVSGNPFKVPRPETVRKGSLAILEYLRSKITP